VHEIKHDGHRIMAYLDRGFGRLGHGYLRAGRSRTGPRSLRPTGHS